ncbi:uncharacterized protein LOC108908766 [Anoplophora glabripennis]|uniref:uncharacterized protein LOC108908766 n=1 Tax=Anoplophora glabripennis TaxID=217634 RepID=UPI000873D957|nr:uncharacterized protein LOC108908766 [Anoplophora glabripennis]
MDATEMDCYTVGIEVFPFAYKPPPPPKKVVPDKILAILKKYKHNWRLDQLSKPNRVTPKYVSDEEGKPIQYKRPEEVKLDPEMAFYSDQLATPALKNLIHNKKMYFNLKMMRKRFRTNLNKAWNSIYNYYRKRERDKKLKQMKKDKELEKGKGKPKVFEQMETLAKPKKVFVPPPPKERPKQFHNFAHLDVLASPKVYIIQPPKREGVNPHALTYEPTEVVFRLAKLPKRFENLPKMLQPGVVKRAALRYKITPRTEALSVPRTTREKAKDDDDFDPWAIPKNALKYKATPRILDLAKPRERS